MEHSRFLIGLILAALLPQACPVKIPVEEHEDRVILNCNYINWIEGTKGKFFSDHKSLDLGQRILDPQGRYQCGGAGDEANQNITVQVYYRTADTQVLLRNDQVYQPLRNRDDAQYSHLGGNWPRNK
ncbi:T-cell surface glycoprotein CD3 delta chain isoform X2 [Tenrec ecaudatus]|uniref:T-cell surface glycoprotein CD3 delta chain isoform X2 n=1 Tax=Tenrec ecaudatus TaxID=94439 RepID=UPI003F59D1D9